MSCSTMLDQMLEADLDELDGSGDSALARHVRDCAPCRTVASGLAWDTRSLARVIDRQAGVRVSTPPSHQANAFALHRRALAGVAAAVSLLAVRAWQQREPSAVRLAPPTAVSLASSGSAATVSGRALARPMTDTAIGTTRSDRTMGDAGVRSRHSVGQTSPPRPVRMRQPDPARAVASIAESITTDRVTVAPVSRPPAVAPVRFNVALADQPLGDGVTVDPPTGLRARVIRTSTPGVTVVWLHQ